MQNQKQQTMPTGTLLLTQLPFNSDSIHFTSGLVAHMSPEATSITHAAGSGWWSYLLAPVYCPGPPGSWQSPPPPRRAFQTQCQPWRTTPSHSTHTNSNTPNTVTKADLSLSFFLLLSLSLSLSLSPSSLFACSWCERVSTTPGRVPSYEWMEMREVCECERKRVEWERKGEEWCLL